MTVRVTYHMNLLDEERIEAECKGSSRPSQSEHGAPNDDVTVQLEKHVGSESSRDMHF